MSKVAEILGMEQEPTSTWARHSFATNLNNSGKVPHKYISDSMGHSGRNLDFFVRLRQFIELLFGAIAYFL